MTKINRRSFIKAAGVVAGGTIIVPTIIQACSRGKDGHTAPSDRINVAFIGAGNQAGNDIKDFLKRNFLSKNAIIILVSLSTAIV